MQIEKLDWLYNNIDYSKNVYVIIDADSIIFKIAFDKKQTPEDIEMYGDQTLRTFDDVKKQYDEYVNTILKNIKATYYKLFFTQKSFRYYITDSYKKTRHDKYFEKPKYFDSLKEYALSKDDALSFPNLEADDLICIFSNWFKNSNESNENLIIVGWDKDLYQIPGIHYNPTKNEIYIINEKEASFLFWKQVLQGDNIDNIQGLPGIGPKKAESILLASNYETYPYIVFDKYIKQFGILEGVTKFCETYNLVKLKSKSCFEFNPENIIFTEYNNKIIMDF